VDFNAWVTADNATGMPAPADGRLAAPSGPGLGVDVLEDTLGDPFVHAR
jgi:L-alanine-DL-glutamate epimerase-like enolase superfamily enzyme